ncbi:hypothetical protein I4U23_022948 [Adineta vaga]|nr:hypothetical protein I4U23_022948 [Adineta vaga]
MDRVTRSAIQPNEKTDWQLFTNDGKFDSKLPPYKRLLRLKSAPVSGKSYMMYAVPVTKPNKVLIPEKPQPQVENVENYVLVWLDQSTGKAKNNEASKKQLKQVINCVKIFTDPKECQTYMSSIKDEKIFLIVSGIVEEDFVSNVHDEEQLESIYVLCPNKIKEEPWFSKYPEIAGVYTTIMSLCEQLGKDMKKIDRTLLGIEIMGRATSNSTSKTDQQDASFMYDQLFRDIVLKVPDENMEDIENREVSLRFIRDARVRNNRVFVLMEITVEKNAIVPAANVTQLSYFPTESEWLFSMGSVFRVGPIKSFDGIWIVPLTLTDDHDKRLNALKEYFKKSMTDSNTCLSFAKLMYQLAKWKQSEYFYEMALKSETTPGRRSVIFNDLATVKGELKQYDQALALYEMSLELRGTVESDKATTYNNIGTLYYELKKKDRAKEYYQKALEACNTQENNNEELIATLHGNIAGILNDQGKHEEALEKCEEALKIRLKHFPEIHPRIAISYCSIANTLQHLKMYEKAIEFIEKALDIDRQALPSEHPQTLLHKNNLEVYKQQLQQQSN